MNTSFAMGKLNMENITMEKEIKEEMGIMKNEKKEALQAMNEVFENQKEEMREQAGVIREKILESARGESGIGYHALSDDLEENGNGMRGYVESVKSQIFFTMKLAGTYLSSEEKARLLDMGAEMDRLYAGFVSEIELMMLMYEAFEESGRLR